MKKNTFIERRDFLKVAAGIAAASAVGGLANGVALATAAPGATATAAANPNVVQTSYGPIEGSAENGIRVFRGVPYAQPPVGALRFRAPQKLQPWKAIRPAKQDAPASYQTNLANSDRVLALANQLDPNLPGENTLPDYVLSVYNQANISEDCLYLDIWVPPGKAGSKLPVFLYYHGGGSFFSSGSFNLERGANLAAQENIIVVRPNYRLGALGWVHFGLISKEFPDAVNLGLQDQLAALQWVSENIGAFGGDPQNITVAGESTGATAVSHFLTNPNARPYFKRAVMQSLSPYNTWCTQQPADAVTIANKYLQILKISDVSQLKTLDPIYFLAMHSIMLRYFSPDANIAWRPLGGVVDGNWIPQNPAQYLSMSNLQGFDKEVLIGFARDEWQFFRGRTSTIANGTRAQALAVLTQVYGTSQATQLFDGYSQLYPGQAPGQVLSAIMSFEFFKFSSLQIGKNLAAHNLPVYLFEFTYDLPGDGGYLHATHTGDMPFLWRNTSDADLASWPSFDGANRADVRRISNDISVLYDAYIRNGQPAATWEPFEATDQAILSFGEQVQTVKHLLTKEWDLFQAHGAADVKTLEDLLVANLHRQLAQHAQP